MTTNLPYWFPIVVLGAGLSAVGLATLLLTRNRWSQFNRSVALALGVSGLVQLANGTGLVDDIHALLWRRVAFVAELFQPVALLYIGLSLLQPAASGAGLGARWRARAVFLLAVVLGALALSGLVYVPLEQEGILLGIGLGPLGRVCYIFIILSLALALAQIEQILRATPDPLRYQIKFVLIGLGGLGGYAIYQASRILMVPVWNADYILAGTLTMLISVGLVAYGLARTRLREVRGKVYVSPQVLYGSLTFLMVGLYLLSVGVIGEVIRHSDQGLSLGLSTSVVFMAVVGLVVVLYSRKAKAELRRFIARHFYRSKYDYRAKWLEVTEAFRGCTSAESILDRLMDVISRTFGAGRISIWICYEADGQFHQVRSSNTEPPPEPLKPTYPVISALMATDEPLNLGPLTVKLLQGMEGSQDAFLKATAAVLGVPIRSEDRLIAFVTLSRELHGEPYGNDDFDLLKALAHHVAMLLSHTRLAEERRAAAEMEAMHRFSAFYLHDLKNLASRLSLVVQNAQVHGQNPSFQQSAMRTVTGTVQKMTELITKLSVQSAEKGMPEPVDLRAAIAEAVSSLNGDLSVSVHHADEGVAFVSIVKDQLQQVLLNVILNAQQAILDTPQTGRGKGEIRIRTERTEGSAVITVADSGPGISLEKLQTLFQPFRTSKEHGLGLGLYQCKRILEDHGGSIRVATKLGRGTEVRIELPLAGSSESSHSKPSPSLRHDTPPFVEGSH